MNVSRRDFLKMCGVSAAVLGLSATELGQLEEALANPASPSVIWLQGSSCTGCSVSFLNRISGTAPKTAADTIINYVNLVYHPQIMALSGEPAVDEIEQAYNAGNYVLVVEGGVPTAFGGAACMAWTYNGVEVTFQQAVTDLAEKAAAVISLGTCASYGGIPASGPNVTGVKSVKAVTGKQTINLAGCPGHPDALVWTIVQILLGKRIALDSNGRPKACFPVTVHANCPRREDHEAGTLQDGDCLREHGCQGPETLNWCPTRKWNGGTAWCVENNAICIACANPAFPGTQPFYAHRED